MKINKVSVIGLGYIGLPLAIMLADKSCKVYGYDIDSNVIENFKNSKIKIRENDLLKKFKSKNVRDNLKVSDKIIKSNVYIIAVPHLLIKKISKPDLSAVKNSVFKIIDILEENNLIIIESTCPVGTTKMIEKLFTKKGLI